MLSLKQGGGGGGVECLAGGFLPSLQAGRFAPKHREGSELCNQKAVAAFRLLGLIGSHPKEFIPSALRQVKTFGGIAPWSTCVAPKRCKTRPFPAMISCVSSFPTNRFTSMSHCLLGNSRCNKWTSFSFDTYRGSSFWLSIALVRNLSRSKRVKRAGTDSGAARLCISLLHHLFLRYLMQCHVML